MKIWEGDNVKQDKLGRIVALYKSIKQKEGLKRAEEMLECLHPTTQAQVRYELWRQGPRLSIAKGH